MSLEKDAKEWRRQARRILSKTLLHPFVREARGMMVDSLEIYHKLQNVKGPMATGLAIGNAVDMIAGRIVSDETMCASYMDAYHDLSGIGTCLSSFMSAKDVLAIPGLQLLIADQHESVHVLKGDELDVYFQLPPLGAASKPGGFDSNGEIRLSYDRKTHHLEFGDYRDRAVAVWQKNILRDFFMSQRKTPARLFEISGKTVNGGMRTVYQMTPVVEDVSFHDTFTAYDGVPVSVFDVASDISAKRRLGRSPAYILDGPGGTGKTTFVKALSELLGGFSVIVSSTFQLSMIGTIAETLAPDVIILDDFDKMSGDERNWMYTSLVTLRSAYPHTAWVMTTNDAPRLGAPLLRPRRGGKLFVFTAPSLAGKVKLLVDQGVDSGIAERVAPFLQADMVHDWVSYIGGELVGMGSDMMKINECIDTWARNWAVTHREPVLAAGGYVRGLLPPLVAYRPSGSITDTPPKATSTTESTFLAVTGDDFQEPRIVHLQPASKADGTIGRPMGKPPRND